MDAAAAALAFSSVSPDDALDDFESLAEQREREYKNFITDATTVGRSLRNQEERRLVHNLMLKLKVLLYHSLTQQRVAFVQHIPLLSPGQSAATMHAVYVRNNLPRRASVTVAVRATPEASFVFDPFKGVKPLSTKELDAPDFAVREEFEWGSRADVGELLMTRKALQNGLAFFVVDKALRTVHSKLLKMLRRKCVSRPMNCQRVRTDPARCDAHFCQADAARQREVVDHLFDLVPRRLFAAKRSTD